ACVLERVRRDEDFSYFVLCDAAGKLIAASGWDPARALPPPDRTMADPAVIAKRRFDAEVPVGDSAAPAGYLRFGMSTAFMEQARRELIRDNLLIAAVGLAISLVAMFALAYWLTHSLTQLTAASQSLAAGDLNVRLPVKGGDEVAKLTHAFNAMAEALQGRIKALADSEAKFTAIADYSYSCECWISPEGELIWINQRVYDMFGDAAAEIIGMRNFPAPFISDADVLRTVRQVRRALRGDSGQDYEFLGRRKDGSEFWAAADWRPIYDSRGGYLGIRISIRDITQRREAERRLEATVQELRHAQGVQQEHLVRAQDDAP